VSVTTRALTPVAVTVRRILAGSDDGTTSTHRAIARPAGAPGWFGPTSAAWQVHGSVATFLGGIRALLLQAAHPRALAGIDGHSSFRQDPFGRLHRTGAFIAATTFGSTELAERTVAGITRLHAHVRGELADGQRYAATDPDLLTWVHVALVDSMLEAYLRFPTNGPLDADAYVADMAVVGAAMGVPDPPRSVADLDGSLAAFGPELEGGALVDDVRQFVLRPPLSAPARAGYAVLARAAEDSLPGWAHDVLGSAPRPVWQQRVNHAAADGLLRTLTVALVESPARRAARDRLGVPRHDLEVLAAQRRAEHRARGRGESQRYASGRYSRSPWPT
jgi:uncharacterized protein (DUF2236 family)